MIDRQVRHLTRLVDDLLDLSRIIRDMLDLRRERLDLAEVLEAAVETSRPLIEECGQAFVVTPPPEPMALDADPIRLAQVIANLLNNAAKYTEAGGHIPLTTEQRSDEAVVTVQDTGIGIPAELLPSIFDMFTQGERSREHLWSGLGIGLTLVKRIVELHGGTVTAQSDGPGHGSTFIVRLPVVKAPAPIPPQVSTTAPPTVPFAPYRILVVDDNRSSAASFALLLRRMGHTLRTAHDGVEAVAVAKAFRPDVVLLDIGLPTQNGYEAARQIRQQPWGQGDAPDRRHRLGSSGRLPARQGCRVRSSPGQAGEYRRTDSAAGVTVTHDRASLRRPGLIAPSDRPHARAR